MMIKEKKAEVIRLSNIHKVFQMGDVIVRALNGVFLSIKAGEFIAIMGSSGSGKSTLMNLLGCLDLATKGDYILDGVNVNEIEKRRLADIRNQRIGFVFQGFNLLARTTALENVELPLLYDRTGKTENPKQRAKQALNKVGLGDRLDHTPSQLSGGQQQRVAIARALVNDPPIILADEPTGNLDSQTTTEVMALFQELNQQGNTIVLVTHEDEVAKYTNRIVELRDGQIVADSAIKNPRSATDDLSAGKTISSENSLIASQIAGL